MQDHRRIAVDPFVEWDHVLCAYGAALDEHRSALTTLHPEGTRAEQTFLPPRFVPPDGLGPLPTELLDRAVALLAQTEGLVALAAELSSELAAVTSPVPAVRPGLAPTGVSTMEQRL
jgi:hypothetical protein